jgi:hypothetical protein
MSSQGSHEPEIARNLDHGDVAGDGSGTLRRDLPWRSWMTPDERARCTYVAHDERPGERAGDIDGLDGDPSWRSWMTPDERARCTYVARDERPRAAASPAAITRRRAAPA